MRVVAIIFCFIFALIAISFVPFVFDSSHDIMVAAYTDTGNVTTGAAETSGNVTLTDDPYLDRLTSVTDITSTNGNDTPIASSYANNTLLVAGLAASQDRALSITYEYDNTSEFPNSGQVLQVVPTFVLIALITLVVAIPAGLVIVGWSKMRGQR